MFRINKSIRAMKICVRLSLILLIVASFTWLSNDRQAVQAHPLNNGYSELTVKPEGVDYELFIPELSLLKYDMNKDNTLSSEELNQQKAQLETDIRENLRLEQEMEPLHFSLISVDKTEKETVPGVSFKLYYSSDKPFTGFTINYNLLFDDADPYHLSFAIIQEGDDIDQTIFDGAHRSYHYESMHPITLSSTLVRYFLLGIEHIVTGYDHLLFLFSLILVAGRFRDIIKIVTAFTVAHSITLFLASMDYINLHPAWVESAIALSICYVAVENIISKKHALRWLLTFLFGLIHGMGFAGALEEIGLPKQYFISTLLTFNLGVETGQLVIVLLVMPLLLWLRKTTRYRTIVVIGSAVIFVQALWWLLERTGVMG
jgi:hydrogenase/urease accessory protein HupE